MLVLRVCETSGGGLRQMIAMAALLLTLGAAVYACFRNPKHPRPEDGHDRAERREGDWYQSSADLGSSIYAM
jgi:hypothetical protein